MLYHQRPTMAVESCSTRAPRCRTRVLAYFFALSFSISSFHAPTAPTTDSSETRPTRRGPSTDPARSAQTRMTFPPENDANARDAARESPSLWVAVGHGTVPSDSLPRPFRPRLALASFRSRETRGAAPSW